MEPAKKTKTKNRGPESLELDLLQKALALYEAGHSFTTLTKCSKILAHNSIQAIETEIHCKIMDHNYHQVELLMKGMSIILEEHEAGNIFAEDVFDRMQVLLTKLKNQIK